MAVVARLQAQAFHEASSFAPLDSLLYYVFQVGVCLAQLRGWSLVLTELLMRKGVHSG